MIRNQTRKDTSPNDIFDSTGVFVSVSNRSPKRLKRSATQTVSSRVQPIRRSSARSQETAKSSYSQSSRPTCTKCSAVKRTQSFAVKTDSQQCQPLERSGSMRYNFRTATKRPMHMPAEEKSTKSTVKRSDSSVLKRSDSSVLKRSDSSALKRSDSAALKRSDSSVLKRSDSSVLKRSDSSVLKRSDSSVLKRSDSSVLKGSDSSALKRSDSSALKGSDSSALKRSDSSSVKRSTSSATKTKGDSAPTTSASKRPGPPSMLSRNIKPAAPKEKSVIQVKRPPPAKKNFLEVNKAALVSKRKPIPAPKSASSTASRSTLSKASKVRGTNPISKMKKRGAMSKSNFSNLGSSKDGKKAGLAGLLHGILGESAPEKENILDLTADADKILGKAKLLLNKTEDASKCEPPAKKIPPPICKTFKAELYCKDCRLLFPTAMLRDFHYRTETHSFVSGVWWKSNPKPPVKLPTHVTDIFCVVCWEKDSVRGNEGLEEHLKCATHTANRKKYCEIFGRAPLYQWCMWSDLSLSFRKGYRAPSSSTSSHYPSYYYEQRVLRKVNIV